MSARAGDGPRAARRGFTLVYVLILAAVVAVGAAAFQRAFLSWHPHAARSPGRARARALLESTWEEARTRLVQGQPLEPLAREGPDERVALRRSRLGQAADQRLEIEVWVRAQGQWVGRRLVLDLAAPVAGQAGLQVASRREVGE